MFFPNIFGPDADQPLDAAIVREKFAQLADEVSSASDKSYTSTQVAEGFLHIAVENMANAIKKFPSKKVMTLLAIR